MKSLNTLIESSLDLKATAVRRTIMDMRAQEEEARIAQKQADQDAYAAAEAEKVVAAEGGVNVEEFEGAASKNRGL